MRDREEILFPVGRLVMGSLYKARTTNMHGEPLKIKTGPNAGQPRSEFFFAVALPKSTETSWAQTEWGKKIYGVAVRAFPKGEFQAPTFAWKIVDGDSHIPNEKGIKPCDRQGYPGNWVLSFVVGFAPTLVRAPSGVPLDMPEDSVNLGDYVQVIGNVTSNVGAPKPGVYLNPSHVAFVGHGQRIFLGIDPKTVPWSKDLPPGASAVPVLPTTPSPLSPPPAAAPIPPVGAPITMPPPYPQILQPPPRAPIVPVRQMTPAAQGNSYESLIAIGWTDETLVQHGLMVPM